MIFLKIKKISILLLSVCMIVCVSSCVNSTSHHQYYIAVIPKQGRSSFFREVASGVNTAATEYNVRTTFEGAQNEEDYDTQNDLIRRAINAKADAIVISAIDENKSNELLEQAVKEGIIVITIDSGVTYEGVSQHIGTDNVESGRIAARELRAMENGQLNIGIVNFEKHTKNAIERERGFLEEIMKHADVRIIDSVSTVSNASEAADATKQMIADNPTINAVVAFNEYTSLGVGYSIRELNNKNLIHVVAFDNNAESIGMIENGEIDRLIVQNPFAMGYLSIESAVKELEKRDSITLEQYTEVLVVNRSNLYEYENQKFVFPFED
ncbi:ribose transport system substrate-binding protein [Breznakia blatticola]|uniref:Ribose transport system substrate-binding protein n=1 Tax=Breznakia blatticola TaxID=1754012 RepID=A0A4R8A651_9FIRM|nr:ribose transport system substrate-binding protein [Breznakia blatticola]